ncbi:histidine phosphatase family protein [Lentzea sp. NPDC058450]|uniref:histidine phosphatase family protein n=1 Tax=Lentzea sp. NPDC058450 TaxID=3346505 RepID=UPI00365504E6
MSSTNLYLVRHGETDWNRERRLQGRIDVPMNKSGKQQAKTTALLLSVRQVDAVVSSPLRRAAKTGEIIARYLDLPKPRRHPLLVEQSYGSAEGLTTREIADRFPGGELPDAEPAADVLARATTALTEIATEHSGRSVVVTTHAALIQTVIAHIAPHDPAVRTAPIRNGSVHSLRWTAAAGLELVKFDDPLKEHVLVRSLLPR